jgi:hypothetical protein
LGLRGVALVKLRGSGDDVHGHDGDLVDRHIVAGIRRRRLCHRPAAYQMGWSAHALGVLP